MKKILFLLLISTSFSIYANNKVEVIRPGDVVECNRWAWKPAEPTNYMCKSQKQSSDDTRQKYLEIAKVKSNTGWSCLAICLYRNSSFGGNVGDYVYSDTKKVFKSAVAAFADMKSNCKEPNYVVQLIENRPLREENFTTVTLQNSCVKN